MLPDAVGNLNNTARKNKETMRVKREGLARMATPADRVQFVRA